MNSNVIQFPTKTPKTEILWVANAMMTFQDGQYKMQWDWHATLPNNYTTK